MSASTLKPLAGLIPWMGLSERIKEAMGDMTPTDFARACKVSPASVTFWLDGKTKSLKAETAAQIQAVTGYSANWIVKGVGPKKAGDSAGVSQWPFSEELRRKVLTLKEDAVTHLENLMRVHLKMAVKVGEPSEKIDLAHGQRSSSTYPARTEEGAPIEGELRDSRAPSKHERQRNRGSSRPKSRGGA
jgi:hypothetical protein